LESVVETSPQQPQICTKSKQITCKKLKDDFTQSFAQVLTQQGIEVPSSTAQLISLKIDIEVCNQILQKMSLLPKKQTQKS
jgi:hypothetical protein